MMLGQLDSCALHAARQRLSDANNAEKSLQNTPVQSAGSQDLTKNGKRNNNIKNDASIT